MSVASPLPIREQHLATTEVLFERLVVAVDLSSASKMVLKTALSVAACFNSQLVLVHAVNPFVAGSDVGLMPADTYELAIEAARTQMNDLIQTEPTLASMKHRAMVEFGDPVTVVQTQVLAENADLVITGSHSPTKLERLALGSIAESIMEHVSCPVMIVGPHARAWQHPFRSILFATDVKTGNLRGAQYASALAERFHGELKLLNVIEPGMERDGLDPEVVDEMNRIALQRMVPQDFEEYAKSTVLVEHGDPAELVDLRARTEGCSLIVAGVPRRSFLADHAPGRTLSAIIHEAPCPVLCVRPHLE